MSLEEVLPEHLAELFHHYHQALAPRFARDSRAEVELWEQVPSQERNRMIAAARLTLLELGTSDPGREGMQLEHGAGESPREEQKRYFAKPGEAEWGC